MKITDVVETRDILTVHAVIERRRFEFAAWRGGPFEVYDYPRTRGGVPRFVGHLPAPVGEHLVDVLLRRGHGSDGYFAARLRRPAACADVPPGVIAERVRR